MTKTQRDVQCEHCGSDEVGRQNGANGIYKCLTCGKFFEMDTPRPKPRRQRFDDDDWE